MDIFVSGGSSLELLRRSRIDNQVTVAPTGLRRVRRSACPYERLGDVAVDRLSGLLAINAAHPLRLHAPDPGHRVRHRLVASDMCSVEFPATAFLGLSSPLLKPGTHGFAIDVPQLSLLQLARDRQRRIRRGILEDFAALVDLTEFTNEMCGSYGRDPRDPLRGACTYGLRPLQRLEDFSGFLAGCSRMRGIALARQAAHLAVESAASPMESLLALLLSLPPELGGIGLEKPLVNQPLDLGPSGRGVQHRRLRPDLYFPGLELALEYDSGEWHDLAEQRREDVRRMQDYAALGIVACPIVFDDLRTPAAAETLLARVISSSSRHMGKRLARERLDLLGDPELRTRRRILLRRLLPRGRRPPECAS
ncbi:hypothetical protein [Olsenella phocaeensis]|uniref:hypothetical protein n=1 Tax=Olsenella phocaeensis TaxID=1852385 RepID=UPI003A8EBAF4